VGGIESGALTRARIVARAEIDARRMCATHRTSNDRAERHLVSRSRTRRLTMGITGPSVVCLDAAGNVPTALRSRIALSAVNRLP
jgi:hypothetical protein